MPARSKVTAWTRAMARMGGMPTAKVNPRHHVLACPEARTGNKQLMHRRWMIIRSLLGGLSLVLSGCVSADQPALEIRKIFVQEDSGAAAFGLPAYDAVIHDASVRVLAGRGYVPAQESDAGEAVLRPSWISRSPANDADGAKVALRLTLERNDGRVLRTFMVLEDVPVRFLSQERIADQVRARLGTISRGPTAAP